MRRPTVVQHSFGEAGSGGPIGVVERLLCSRLAEKYNFVRLHQQSATGGIDLSRIRTWTAQLRLVRPDLVHVRGLGNEGFHAAVAARRAGCPRILVSIHGTVRDLAYHRRSLRRFVLAHGAEPLTLAIATDIATVCHFATDRDFVLRHRSKVVGIVPNGTPLPALRDTIRNPTRALLGYAEDDIVGILVGRLSLEKGHLYLADVLRRNPVISNRLRLLVVGEGPDSHQIEHSYRAVPGLKSLFLGGRDDVADLLAASDIFIFPTLHENLSNALIEGLASGLPAVATAVGGNIEVLEQGGGLLVARNDKDAFAHALRRLVDDADLRRRIGREARLNVESNYSLDRMLDGWDQLYSRLLGQGDM